MFQSTPPHGGRPSAGLCFFYGELCFNPRPRTGGDRSSRRSYYNPDRFQSTPPHGGRHVSIHAPARGATSLI